MRAATLPAAGVAGQHPRVAAAGDQHQALLAAADAVGLPLYRYVGGAAAMFITLALLLSTVSDSPLGAAMGALAFLIASTLLLTLDAAEALHPYLVVGDVRLVRQVHVAHRDRRPLPRSAPPPQSGCSPRPARSDTAPQCASTKSADRHQPRRSAR